MTELHEILEKAKADLTKRLGVDPKNLTNTIHVENVTWRDGSLGLPEPNQCYTLALVPGYRITFTVDGRTHAYHTDAAGTQLKYNADDD